MSSADVSIASVHVPHNVLFDFAINFLNYCESNKKWVKTTGYTGATCGYTGPGIGLVIKIFQHNGIYDRETLQAFLHSDNFTEEQFIDIINETIGNFADFIMDVCPVTDAIQGTRGLLEKEFERARPDSPLMQTDEPAKVFKVEEGGRNLVEGVNVISFATRAHMCATFHHATLFIDKPNDICFIIDSWSTPADVEPFECRPLTFRQFTFSEVIHALDRLNSDDISLEETIYIFQRYFIAHQSFLHDIQNYGLLIVHTVNPDYIEKVYAICEDKIKSGKQTMTDFGGQPRKKNRKLRKKTRKLRKKSKKYRKTVRKYKK